MGPPAGNAPAWLFSFVDLAFLLMIAMTQLAGNPNAVDLGEIVVPAIQSDATAKRLTGAADRWQVRVHPPAPELPGAERSTPFELVGDGESTRLALPELRARLADVRAAVSTKPLLAPHADSRSQDMLDALTLLEELWPSLRRASVRPLPSGL